MFALVNAAGNVSTLWNKNALVGNRGVDDLTWSHGNCPKEVVLNKKSIKGSKTFPLRGRKKGEEGRGWFDEMTYSFTQRAPLVCRDDLLVFISILPRWWRLCSCYVQLFFMTQCFRLVTLRAMTYGIYEYVWSRKLHVFGIDLMWPGSISHILCTHAWTNAMVYDAIQLFTLSFKLLYFFNSVLSLSILSIFKRGLSCSRLLF